MCNRNSFVTQQMNWSCICWPIHVLEGMNPIDSGSGSDGLWPDIQNQWHINTLCIVLYVVHNQSMPCWFRQACLECPHPTLSPLWHLSLNTGPFHRREKSTLCRALPLLCPGRWWTSYCIWIHWPDVDALGALHPIAVLLHTDHMVLLAKMSGSQRSFPFVKPVCHTKENGAQSPNQPFVGQAVIILIMQYLWLLNDEYKEWPVWHTLSSTLFLQY